MSWSFWPDFDEEGDTLDFCIGLDAKDPQLVTLLYGRPGAEALARQVVTALNCHDELMAALEILTRAVNVAEPDPLAVFASIEKARHVLAKAKGTTA
jgi:hypothetical protein